MFRSKKKKQKPSSQSANIGPFSWVKHFAAFYVILLALTCIPFLIIFVVLSIRTVLEYALWILPGVAVLLVAVVTLVVRRKKEIQKRFEAEKKDVMEVIRTAAKEGHDVNISFMHGLIRLDYQGTDNSPRLLEGSLYGRLKELPATTSGNPPNQLVVVETENHSEIIQVSIATELEKLSGLLNQGVVNEDEFRALKQQLLESNNAG